MYKCHRNSRKTPIDWLNLYIVKSKSKGKMHRIRNNWGWHQHERTKPCVLQLCCFVHFSSSNLLIEKSLFFEKKRNATIHTSQHFQFLCFCEIIILVLILDNKQTHQSRGIIRTQNMKTEEWDKRNNQNLHYILIITLQLLSYLMLSTTPNELGDRLQCSMRIGILEFILFNFFSSLEFVIEINYILYYKK